MRNIRIPQVFTLIRDTLHHLFAVPLAFTLSRELEL